MATNFLLVNVFTAFLPPRDPDEGDFYEILGLTRRATPEDIRRAYKVKSLQLHPDKVAQRGEDAASAARQYERVQEAYACLNDQKNREQYHQLKSSPAYYRFVVTNAGGFLHPVALYENLQKASCVDKTRLVVLVTLFLMLALLQPILVAAKVNQTVRGSGALTGTPWVTLLTPLWVSHGLFLGLMLVLSTVTRQPVLVASLLEHTCWLAGEVLLARQWDRSGTALQLKWHVVSVPFYLGLVFRILSAVLVVMEMLRTQMRMISPDKLRADHPDWTDEQFMAAEDEYCIITVDEEAVEHSVHLLTVAEEGPVTEEDLEALRIELSPEYQATSSMIKDQSKSVLYILVFGFTFVALVASKLEDQIFVSWWTVFVPIWVYLGQSILYYLLVCCCLSTGDPVMIIQRPQNDGDEEAGAANDQEPAARPGPSSSSNFASVEGSMKEFNEQSAPEVSKPATDTPERKAGEMRQCPAPASVSETPAPARDDKPPRELAVASENPEPEREEDVNDVQEERMPHLDEDTFRAWQHAQEKAESSAMEKEAKASSACCLALFQLIIVCLIVGILQRDYEQPNPTGYNAMWVLFPIFLVVGLIFCLCACLIYGPAYEPESTASRPENATENEDVETGQRASDSAATPTPDATNNTASSPPSQHSSKAESTEPAAESAGPAVADLSPQGVDEEKDLAPSDEGGSNRAPSDEGIDMNDLD
jgi:hypothetical protein